jgi:cytochrome c peroxidase
MMFNRMIIQAISTLKKPNFFEKLGFWRTLLLLGALLVFAACVSPESPMAAPMATPIPTFTPRPVPPRITTVIDGLLGPIGLAALPDGSLLVAEEGTGGRDDSAGVTLVTADGQAGRFISGLPSTFDSGDLAGVPLVSLGPDGETLYVGNFGAGHLWTLPLPPDQLANGFTLPATPYTPEDMGVAMEQFNNVMLINPYDIVFDDDGVPVVTDATGNGVAKETPDGKTHFFHRFADLPNPDQPGDFLQAVPTGIIRHSDEEHGDEYWVTLLSGCPYPDGAGELVAIDEARNQRTVLGGLTMPIDVAQGPDGTIWVLEFARFTPGGDCFSGHDYQVDTGRLSRLNEDGSLETVLDNLNFPGAVLPMPDGSLYISEVFPGRVIHVVFDESAEEGRDADALDEADAAAAQPAEQTAIQRSVIQDYDKAMQIVIDAYALQANPGADLREGDTPQARLGQLLFFDPILSGDLNAACSTCHHPALAMADGRALPIGTGGQGLGAERTFVEEVTLADEASNVRRLAGVTDEESGRTIVHNPFIGQFVGRNSPTIINSAMIPNQFWDGRVDRAVEETKVDEEGTTVKTLERAVNDMAMEDSLATQALFPMTSLHEMSGATLGGLAPQAIRNRLVERLRTVPAYVDAFRAAYGSEDETPEEAITLERLADALAAFERQVIYTDAPWDEYLKGDESALTEQQKRGALLFFGQVDPLVNCASCHSGDIFTDFQYHNILAPQLGPGKGHGYSGREDWGRAGVTFDVRDRYAFRTPSLRNVELTAPYLHDGAFPTLEATIRHHANISKSVLGYDPTANDIPPDLYSSMRPVNLADQWLTADPRLRDGLPLSDDDIADLAAFLTSLTDPEARDLRDLEPDAVPSGLPMDPWPDAVPASKAIVEAAPEENESPTPVETGAAVEQPAEAEAPAIATDFSFTDVAADRGVDFQHGSFAAAIYADANAAMSGGLCWIDYDNDGWMDLYLVNNHAEDEEAYWQENGGLPRNKLYHNEEGRFVDVSAESGADLAIRGNGCLAADFNNDGWTDIHVTVYGPDALLWNNGDGTFTEGAAAAGVDTPEWNSAAVAGDLNDDGFLDMFVAAFIDLDKQIPKPSGAFPQDYYGLPDHLYLNNGDGTFREITDEIGLDREERGLGALLTDADLDGDLDLYIANDGHPNRFYRNDPWPGGAEADPLGLGFRLTDVTSTADVGDSGSGMGVNSSDYDNDGWPDLVITNWERELNAVYHNETGDEGDLAFQYSTFRLGMMGLGNNITGWGVALADFDQDTDPDLLIANGRVPVTNLETDPEWVRYFRNRTVDGAGKPPRPGQFLDWTGQVGLKEVGPRLSRGSAVADYDNDGDLDVAINQITGAAVLLENDLNNREREGAPAGHWLAVDLGGMVPGARVTAELPDGRTLLREVHAGSSFISSEDPRVYFGLGPYDQVARLVVTWPDGGETVLEDVAADQQVTVMEERD